MNSLVQSKVKLVVTDLDNTLYDWVGFFVPAFYAMAEEASAILGVDLKIVLDDLRSVHQLYGSSEHPFALLETDIVNTKFSSLTEDERRTLLDPAFHRFNSVRKRTLVLYDGVLETLRAISDMGITIVAYTDARIPNSVHRVKSLGLDRFVRRLYAPAARFSPGNEKLVKGLTNTLVQVLPGDDKKPNPRALLDICANVGVAPSETLYVGDSLTRDIYMANSASVRSAWAKYGARIDPELWSQLVRVTHWTDVDVENEARLKAEAAGAIPDEVLNCFSELLRCVSAG